MVELRLTTYSDDGNADADNADTATDSNADNVDNLSRRGAIAVLVLAQGIANRGG